MKKRRLLRAAAVLLCIAALVLPCLLPRGSDGARIENRYEYEGVLTLYNLDSFEGGVGSRADFLSRAALRFEKKYKGVFVQVVPVSEYELTDRLGRGLLPDLFLYSYGYDHFLADYVQDYTGRVNFLDNLDVSEHAVPVWMGGYFTFARAGEHPYVAGYGAFNDPVLACVLANDELVPEHVEGQKAAYEQFVFHEKNLIGTQRDVIRTEKDGENVAASPLGGFSDLVQFGAVVPINEERAYFSQLFLEYLTSDEVQKDLGRIGMFSTTGERLYDGVRGEFEALIPGLAVPKLDRTREQLQEERQRAQAALADPAARRALREAYGK